MFNWKKFCDPIGELLFSQSRRTSILLGSAFLIIVGFCDYVTGYEAIVTVFYLLPISIFAWAIGQKAGFVMAVISEITETSAELVSRFYFGSFPSYDIFVAIWNGAVKILFFMIFVYTISKLKAAYEEQKRLIQELQDRALALELANEDLESFSYAASHDLRSPLITIEGFANLLLKNSADKLDDKGKDFLKMIANNAKKMSQLINDLYSFTRVSAREIQKSEINMEDLAQGLFEELKLTTGKRNIQFVIKQLPSAYGELAMVRQVLLNLLTNAIKFTSSRETALIEVGGYGEFSEKVFYVKDDGVGFDMSLARRLFGLFQRIHASSEFEGTGIGLVIVKKVIEKHGGRVWAEGKENEGATFYFSLPDKQA